MKIRSVRFIRFFLVLSSCSLLSATAAAQAPGEAPSHARLAKLAFITGHWRGEMHGGVIEEDWSSSEGDNMMGMFRLVKDGEGVFYEFMTIEQAGETPVLRLRHFSQGLVAWEEKGAVEAYPLVELGEARAVFENENTATRLTYECPSTETLVITLEKKNAGKTSSQVFSFTRMQ